MDKPGDPFMFHLNTLYFIVVETLGLVRLEFKNFQYKLIVFIWGSPLSQKNQFPYLKFGEKIHIIQDRGGKQIN